MAMARARSSCTATLAIVLLLMTLVGESYGQLKVGFYTGKCGTNDVEKVIFSIVKAAFNNDRTIVAALLLLQFHDCFVRGCDASILLDGSNTEKTAWPKHIVRGYDIIDTIKAILERRCPQVVSCADIIVISTRVAIFLAGGVWYDVENGRRDGAISLASEATANLSAGSTTIQVPHTVIEFATNFLTAAQINGVVSTAMDAAVTANQYTEGTFIQVQNDVLNYAMSTLTGTQMMTFLSIYTKVVQELGGSQKAKDTLEKSGQQILTESSLNTQYVSQFVSSMKILGRTGVLAGSEGQIRKNCRRVNDSILKLGTHGF
ncbi:peroxidase 57 [Beta vulgaris subsp. vulgaris]|uniref:peroxidase 57 n=1 Tax=Beta vulgaris subsp. vulgaris TaxID=3555 RepID=UPI002036E803|nr:peroxidase 57 [Beta vulgaris subsp. vulgaris]